MVARFVGGRSLTSCSSSSVNESRPCFFIDRLLACRIFALSVMYDLRPPKFHVWLKYHCYKWPWKQPSNTTTVMYSYECMSHYILHRKAIEIVYFPYHVKWMSLVEWLQSERLVLEQGDYINKLPCIRMVASLYLEHSNYPWQYIMCIADNLT